MPTFLLLLLLAQIPNLPALNGTVTGVLRTASGKPAAGVRVSAVVPPASATDEFKATAMASLAETDAEGRFRLEGVPPGRYYISAGRVDFPTYFPGSTILSDGTLVLVTPGSTVSNINFVLRDESSGRSGLSMLYLGPQGFIVPVTISVEGGGKVPVFQNGTYPFIRATDVSNKNPVEILLSASTLSLPLPSSSKPDEYSVTVNDLQGYTVKSITYGSTDLKKETLKAQRPGSNVLQSFGLVGNQIGPTIVSGTPLAVVLARTATAPTTNGVHVSGRSVGAGDEIYISGKPGTLYSDGTFEFDGVSPGVHKIIKILGTNVTGSGVLVGDRDVDGLVLRRAQLLPTDAFEEPSKPQDGSIPASKPLATVTLAGQVVDETSQEALSEGTVTITGYGNVRRLFAIIAGSGFAISDLLPGTYSITINVSGYRATTQAVTLGAEDLKLDLIAQKETQAQ